MASESATVALRGVVKRLDALFVASTGASLLQAGTVDSADLETLVAAVETASVTFAEISRLRDVYDKLRTAQSKITNEAASSYTGNLSLLQLVEAFEKSSLKLSEFITPAAAPTTTSKNTVAEETKKVKESTKKVEEEPKKVEESKKEEEKKPEEVKKVEEEKKAEEEPKKEDEPKKEEKEEVLLKGIMLKLGGGFLSKSWQERYFELTPTAINWFLNENEKSNVQNSAILSEITSVTPVSEKKYKRNYVFEFNAKKKTYYIDARNESTYNAWLSKLQQLTSNSAGN